MSEIDDFFALFDDDLIEEFDDKYEQINNLFFEQFGSSIPLGLIPDDIDYEIISQAVEKCIETNDKEILKILNVSIDNDAIY